MTDVTFMPLTPEQVLAEHPEAADQPRNLSILDGGLATTAGDRAWLHATPNADGSWDAKAWIAPFGQRTGDPVLASTLTGPSAIYASLAAAANKEADGAYGVVSAIGEAARLARTLATLTPLHEAFPALAVESYGGSFPVQAEGTIHGYEFYFRYRHCSATLTVGGDLHYQALWSSGLVHGEGDQGWLTDAEFIDIMSRLIRDLTRAPMWWEFAGVRTKDRAQPKGNWEVELLGGTPPATPPPVPAKDRAGAPTSMGSWGHTPAEAWDRLHDDEDRYKVTGAQWLAYVAEHGLVNETVTEDERVYPESDPDWSGSPAT